jgi:hypothetical protein
MVYERDISFYITFAFVRNRISFLFRQPQLHENSPKCTGIQFKLAGTKYITPSPGLERLCYLFLSSTDAWNKWRLASTTPHTFFVLYWDTGSVLVWYWSVWPLVDKYFVCTSHIFRGYYMARPSHNLSFVEGYKWRNSQAMSLTFKCFPHHPLLKHPQVFVFFP